MQIPRTKALSLSMSYALYIASGVFFILLVLYACLVTGVILSVVLRQELEVSIKEKNSTLAALEASYLARGQEITEDFAAHVGFVPLHEEEFATRQTLSHAITNEVRD